MAPSQIIEWQPDEWLYVEAKDKDAARRFFGAPEDWPVKFERFRTDRPGKVWAVLATGLTVR